MQVFTFFSFIPHRHFELTPQLLARDRRAVAPGAQLGPGELRMDAAGRVAAGSGDDVFAADDFSERDVTGGCVRGDAGRC